MATDFRKFCNCGLHGNFYTLAAVAAFFLLGIAMILLIAFYAAIEQYSALILRVLIFAAIVLILSLVAYIATNIFLSLQYRAIENQVFQQSQLQLNITDKIEFDDGNGDMERRILNLYHEMTATNSLSLNQIALEVYGKKGGFYNNQIREILQQYHIDI